MPHDAVWRPTVAELEWLMAAPAGFFEAHIHTTGEVTVKAGPALEHLLRQPVSVQSEKPAVDREAVTLFRDLLHFVDYETHLDSHKSWPHMRDRIEAFIRNGNVESKR